MADVSNVQTSELKEISASLNALSCKIVSRAMQQSTVLTSTARILTRILY